MFKSINNIVYLCFSSLNKIGVEADSYKLLNAIVGIA